MLAAAVTRSEVNITHAPVKFLGAIIHKMQEAGVAIELSDNSIKVIGKKRLKPVSITTLPYPGFPTDMQAQFMTLMSLTPGISIISEKIFPDRFMHIAELNRMGAEIRREGPHAIVSGVKSLKGAPVMASDLRASAALVLAGLAAKGKTEISRIYHLDRGYERLDEKLRSLGARIQRVRE
jgi:UDP-N-acetylglucosamine 1-carboxyvinyltransferase